MPKISQPTFAPYWSTTDGETVRLYLGDVCDVLARMPAKSVQTVCTSPPYWGLRSYATGDAKHLEIGSEPLHDCKTDGQAQCGRCFVCSMVRVFREVRRVLRDDGCLWLNLGDSYSGSGKGQNADGTHNHKAGDKQHTHKGTTTGGLPRTGRPGQGKVAGRGANRDGTPATDLPGGNLVGIPWRVALALQADGWVLRQDVIWHKPSPMPESVRNRCTKAHEYIFMLTKSQRYYCDMEAIKEKSLQPEGEAVTAGTQHKQLELDANQNGTLGTNYGPSFRNKRDVWTIASQGYPGAHFATFPPELPRTCILAGTSEHGACADCGAPWRRVTEERALTRERPNDFVKRTGAEGTGNSCANTVAGVEVKTVGWEPTCECHGKLVKRKAAHEEEAETTVTEYISDLPLDQHPVRPCVVMDCFIGAGTSCVVSIELGRWSWGIDLSEKYLLENSIPRVEGVLLSRPATAGLVKRKAPKRLIVGEDRSSLG